MKFIPTKVHGVIDYLAVVAILALPRLLDMGEEATLLLTILAIGALLYSLLTRYELGLLRLLPMKGHLLLDFMAGLLLCAAPFLFLQEETATTRMVLVVMGLFEILTAAMTKSHSPLESHADTGGISRIPGSTG